MQAMFAVFWHGGVGVQLLMELLESRDAGAGYSDDNQERQGSCCLAN